ncbi:hypothetical protein AAFP30_03780 [Gordonia sp. CPCC 205515]|uniref:hypothetical protein n=1 Tax=Gordonia sp. CPCC 205515 TaxID=3140791 RepID=UPI003AF381B2
MTAAIVPALIESNSARRGSSTATPTVDVAGVRWPMHKAHAVAAAVLVALLAFVVTGSGQVTMWASAAALLTVWWGERAFQTFRHDARTAPASR